MDATNTNTTVTYNVCKMKAKKFHEYFRVDALQCILRIDYCEHSI
jgi:hypothetical protein